MFNDKRIKLVLVAFIFFPIIVQYTGLIHGTSGNGDWLGFWGSYLGFIPSGLIAYLVLKEQFERQSEVDKNNFKKQIINQKQEYLFEQEYSSLTEVTKIIDESYLFLKRNEYTINSGEVNNPKFIEDFYRQFTNQASLIDANINSIENWILESSQLNNYGKNFQDCIKRVLKSKEDLYKKRNLLQNKIALKKSYCVKIPDEIKNFKLQSMATDLGILAESLRKLKQLILNKKVEIKSKISA